VRPTTTCTSPTKRNSRLAALVAGALLVASLAAAAATPHEVVQHLADQVIVVLKDKSLSSDVKRGRIEQLVYAVVDFDTLSRLVLARNWSRFSADEQTRFRDEFKRHLSVTYGKSIDSYKNEEVSILGEQDEARGDKTVKTKILRGGGSDDIAVDYRLREVDGQWKIIDFVVVGVSMVANFRSQFQDLLASKSPSELIALIHEKNEKGESLEKKAS
jgi:phospholipid transport system substrate-binding protein